MNNSILNCHIWKFKRSNISGAEYNSTRNPPLKSPWGGFRNFTRHYFMYLILAQIHFHTFNFSHQIQRKINTLKNEKPVFETNIKLCNMRFDKIKISEGVVSRKKVITKDYYWKFEVKEPLSIIFLNICMLLNYFLFDFNKLKMKKKKGCSSTLSFLYFTCLHSY